MSGHYILDDNGEPKEEPDLLTWARWLESADRHVAHREESGVRVSTVFLGLDLSFGDGGPRHLWETMILGGPNDSYQERYSTRQEAEAGHLVAEELAFGDVNYPLSRGDA